MRHLFRRTLGRPRRQWVDNLGRDVQDLGVEGTRTEHATDGTERKMERWMLRLWILYTRVVFELFSYINTP